MPNTLTPPDIATGQTLCPHCKKRFDPAVDRDQPLRLQGAKCPSCKLFVPARSISWGDLPLGSPEPRS